MIKLTISVASDNIIGVKETLAEYLQKYGDTKVISVEQIRSEQTSIYDTKGKRT